MPIWPNVLFLPPAFPPASNSGALMIQFKKIGAAFLVVCLTVVAQIALAGPSTVQRLSDDVLLVRDDTGIREGQADCITHQCGAEYQAKKLLDLSGVSEEAWKTITNVRLSAYFCVYDHSLHVVKKTNGLDEAVEIVVNGKPHRIADNAGLPVFPGNTSMAESMRWHDFEMPKNELIRGQNEVILRMAPPPGKTPDDYLYLGIDNSAAGGNSWVKFNRDENWRQDKLTVPGAKGEYMVRLYLLSGPQETQSIWRPQEGRTDDPKGMLLYAGSHGDDSRMEWKIDRFSPVTIEAEVADNRAFEAAWLDKAGNVVSPPLKAQGPHFQITLSSPLTFVPSGIRFPKDLPLRSVTLKAHRDYHPAARPIDMAPHIAAPKGAAVARTPFCRMDGNKIELENQTLRCRFNKADNHLRLESLYNELASAEMIRQPDACSLFLVEMAGKRYGGSRDFSCRAVTPMKTDNAAANRSGFTATLYSEEIKLEALLSVWIDDSLRMGVTVTNRRDQASDFKLACPHLAGLAISDQPADDFYFFPWGGGVIADVPAILRRGYGDHEALYQVMDIFSPARGAGLAIACTDQDGRHKVLALRKFVPGQPEVNGDMANTPTAEEYKWTNSLPTTPGIGVAYEYLRRTRKPGESFAAKDVAISAHAGDWHAAVKAYADWCHRVWKFRPYPSRLDTVINMLTPGWGQDILFRDGKYIQDFPPQCDCAELMSWWEWSPLGPKSVPLEEYAKKMGEDSYKNWQSYFVKDPVTGRLMFNNNPGDYDGYNARFGGLPTLRDAIHRYQKAGHLVTLYTDPLRVDDNTKCGRQWGKLWGVVQPDGKYRNDYDAWRMCHDVAEYRRWVADAMGRVLRETDADGIRLDEYGHCGSACFSTLHEHTFAEKGTTEWMRSIAETTKLVRESMDKVKPASVLTTEHPGYDFLMPFIEGCITYDLSVQATPLRPLECNLQRFYFPECKAYEFPYRQEDPSFQKRFWNAVAPFGAYCPAELYGILHENRDVFSSRDCQPLIPTEMQYVYANRFTAGNKSIYMLFNATGHSLVAPVLKLHPASGEHVIDLLHGQNVDVKTENNAVVVNMFLARNTTTCLLQCPAQLLAKRWGDGWEFSAAAAPKSCQIAICDAKGSPLVVRPLGDGTVRCASADLPKNAASPAYAKLLDGDRLLDAAPLPK